jgi:23S rRNA pseudouridine955/2504/2580 synthase
MKIALDITAPQVQTLEISEEHHGQRVDNFLLAHLKGVPKSRIYRMLRSGEVRVNKGRCEASRRLHAGDWVRIPPVRVAPQKQVAFVPTALKQALQHDILFEDEVLLIVNKPPGFAVHGGSGIDSGVIEGLRQLRPEAKFLELVHRLDRDTSGCLLIAKKGAALRKLHELFRGDGVEKTYVALLAGQWARKKQLVNAPLLKNVNKGGERMVVVSSAGKEAETLFRRIRLFERATLVEASPKTGRTHQIRVHAAYFGHPIVGDERYGVAEVNREFKNRGIARLFLHAEKLRFAHPASGQLISVTAPLPDDLTFWLEHEK